ncbi:hypothetical protein M3N55_05800 [Roseibaca sp. V10]|uniref:Uncharacterized protein n=1 Tax=Roseinatronobacter domitianus TaxID=2940293 RepID=A0ABT0M0V8_9RHOB|nr:hypothetical protein [Roseibaca domitiana]MCL1628238.1 hypothetical protein [Roseibaca domitiana]
MTHAPDMPQKRRSRSWLVLIAGLLCLVAGVFVKQDANPVVSTAERAAEQIAVASTGVYVSLRVINAFLSTAQEVELGASMVGQASIQPLKVLEPVDDTIERVADAIFLVAAASALAAVAMGPVVSIGLVVLGLGLIGMSISAHSVRFALIAGPACSTGVSFGIVVAFLIPLFFSVGVWVGERATQDRMDEATAQLRAVAQQAEASVVSDDPQNLDNKSDEAENSGFFLGVRTWLGEARDGAGSVFADSAKYLTAGWSILDQADTILSASMTIIGVFILRMVVLPVFLVLGAVALLKRFRVPDAHGFDVTPGQAVQPPPPAP